MESLAKLDAYDYMVLPGVIRIELSTFTDPDLVDILSEIERNDNNVYVEGVFYKFLGGHSVYENEETNGVCLDLDVVEQLKV